MIETLLGGLLGFPCGLLLIEALRAMRAPKDLPQDLVGPHLVLAVLLAHLAALRRHCHFVRAHQINPPVP